MVFENIGNNFITSVKRMPTYYNEEKTWNEI